MTDGKYYNEKLSAQRLQRVYDIAPPRVQQHLNAEIEHVLSCIRPSDSILELGCGYGRALKQFAVKAQAAVGIDLSPANIEFAREYLKDYSNIDLHVMDALATDFADGRFDVVVCIQNGISAFGVDPFELVQESLRVTKPGGIALFSSYSGKFWEERLYWFELQAKEGLLGEIDYKQTGNGVIVCKDGFRATAFSAEDFNRIAAEIDAEIYIEEVDESSLFCTLKSNDTIDKKR